MNEFRALVRGDRTDELVATVAILKANAVPPRELTALLDYIGSAVDLLPPALGGADIDGRPPFLAALSADTLIAAESEVRSWTEAGLVVRTVLEPEYPANLQTIYDKPPFVFLHGEWTDATHGRGVAIVGTRSATPDGCKRARKLARGIAEAGITVVSGLAKGIDTHAHRGALDAGGRTVAVMGTGISRRYPRENAGLADEIVATGGTLLSQFFPDQPPARWTFPARNRTMSGIALATVVVEAGATSGARLQAEAALVHGRPVLLPTSLISAHGWAQEMVDHGHKGARAIQVASVDEVLDHLTPSVGADLLIA